MMSYRSRRSGGRCNQRRSGRPRTTRKRDRPHIAKLVGEEICTVARRTVEVCQRCAPM
jgi:hypothetical protein